jgi:hypothetical protein
MILEAGGVDTTKVKDPIFIVYVTKIMDHMSRVIAEFHGRGSKKIDTIKKRTKVRL